MEALFHLAPSGCPIWFLEKSLVFLFWLSQALGSPILSCRQIVSSTEDPVWMSFPNRNLANCKKRQRRLLMTINVKRKLWMYHVLRGQTLYTEALMLIRMNFCGQGILHHQQFLSHTRAINLQTGASLKGILCFPQVFVKVGNKQTFTAGPFEMFILKITRSFFPLCETAVKCFALNVPALWHIFQWRP